MVFRNDDLERRVLFIGCFLKSWSMKIFGNVGKYFGCCNRTVLNAESLTVSDTSPRLTASTSRTTSVNYVFEATFRVWQSWVIVGGPVSFAKTVRSVAFTQILLRKEAVLTCLNIFIIFLYLYTLYCTFYTTHKNYMRSLKQGIKIN